MCLVVIVQAVGSHQLYQRHVLHLLLRNIRKVHARRITLVLHVEAELILFYGRGQIVHVAHHQLPVRHRRCLTGVLQRLHIKCVRGIARHVGSKLSHLIHLAVISIFEGHGQHLVGLQSGLQRDIAHRLVYRVLRGTEQPDALHLLIRETSFESVMTVEHRRGLLNVSGIGVCGGQQRIQRTGIVGRRNSLRSAIAKVVECHDMAGVRRVSRLVGHPHLHAVDGDARHHVGQFLHGGIVFLAEEGGEEEVAVLLVVRYVHLEGSHLRAALSRNALRRRFLLRHHRLQLQLSELQVGAYTEQARCSPHQRRVGGERHVAAFHQLDDLVFLAVVFQFHVLGVVVERGIGVVVQVHVHLVAHLSVDAQVNLLVEVHRRGLAVADRQRRIVHILHRGTQLQLSRSLRLHAHTARTEYFLGRPQVEVHIGEVELLLALGLVNLVVLLAEEIAAQLSVAPFPELLGGHQHRRAQIAATHLRADEITSQRVVILHLLLDVLGHNQVGGITLQVFLCDRLRALNPPSRMQQRVGNLLIVDQQQ